MRLSVGDLDGRRARDRDGRQNLSAGILNLDDLRTGKRNGGSTSAGDSAAEGDGVEAGEVDLRAALLEVLDDPLSILLCEGGGGGRSRDGLSVAEAGGDVLYHDSTTGGGGSSDGDADGLASAYGEAADVNGEVGEPLVPSLVRNGAARGDREVDSRLENGVAGGVTINTDPCRGRKRASPSTRGTRGSGDVESTRNGGELLACRRGGDDSSCPIRTELDGLSDVTA